MRLPPLKTGDVVDLDGFNQVSPELAERQVSMWDRQWASKLDQHNLRDWRVWDSLAPEQRAFLQQIYETGVDNVTRRKIGLTELE